MAGEGAGGSDSTSTFTPKTRKRHILQILKSEATPQKIVVRADPDTLIGSCLTCKGTPRGHLRQVQNKEYNYRDLLRTVLLLDLPPSTSLQICDTCIKRLLEVSAWRQSIVAKMCVHDNPPGDISVEWSGASDNGPLCSTSAEFESSVNSSGSNVTAKMLLSPHQSFQISNQSLKRTHPTSPSTSTPSASAASRKVKGRSRKQLLLSPVNCSDPVDHVTSETSRSSCVDHSDHAYALSEPLSETMNKVVQSTSILKVKDDTERQLLTKIDTELDLLASIKEPSILRSQAVKDLQDPGLHNRVAKELNDHSPFLYKVLRALAAPIHRTPDNTIPTIAAMYAMGLYNRNTQLSLWQRRNTAVAVRCGASNLLLDIFQKQSITTTHHAKYAFLDGLGKFCDDKFVKALKLKKQGKLTVDNIDGHIIANQIRNGIGNRDFHYAAATYYVDRLNLDHLSLQRPLVLRIDPAVYFLTADETNRLKKAYLRHIIYILKKHFKTFKWMTAIYEEFPEHGWSEVMDKMSEIFPLEVMPEDPKDYDGALKVLSRLSQILQKAYNKAGRGDDLNHEKIPTCGDQLIRVRFDGALALRDGAHTFKERYEFYQPVAIEFFHVMQDYLEKLFMRFYKQEPARNPCTLPAFKNLIERRNINGTVKSGRYEAHSEFLLMSWECLMVEFILNALGMQSTDDPLPPHMDVPPKIHTYSKQAQLAVANHLSMQILDMFYTPLNMPVNPAQPAPIRVLNINDDGMFVVEPNGSARAPGRNVQQPQDGMRSYCLQLLQWGIHFREFKDAIKNGDIERHVVNVKRMLPLFFEEFDASSRYAMELVNWIAKTEVLLSDQMSLRVKLSALVNPTGGRGNNKPADMQQENLIKIIKSIIRYLGAQKTEKSIIRCSMAAPVIIAIVSNMASGLSVRGADGSHPKKDDTEDIATICAHLRQHRPFELLQGRELPGFNLSDNLFSFDMHKYLAFLERHSNKAMENM